MENSMLMSCKTEKIGSLLKIHPEVKNLNEDGLTNSDEELATLENEIENDKLNGNAAKSANIRHSDSGNALKSLEDLDNKDFEVSSDFNTLTSKGVKLENAIRISQPNLINSSTKVVINSIKDIYPVNIEKMFHKPEKFSCMSVLSAEQDLMNTIIEYKRLNRFEQNYFENKKLLLNATSDKFRNMIENEIITIVIYKSNIESQKAYENSMLEAIIKKKESFDCQVFEVLIERLNHRIALIDAELSEKIHENEPENKPNQIHSPITSVKEESTENAKSDINDPTIENKIVEPSQAIGGSSIIADTELISICNNKFELYKVANKYFVHNGFTEQAQDAANKASLIFREKQKLLKGQHIDEFSLPIDVTSEYINGCSRNERTEKYLSLAKDFVGRKNKLNESLKDISEKLKLLDKRELDKRSDQIKKMIFDKKLKIEEYDKTIKKIIEMSKNPWIPFPLICMDHEDEKIEVINTDIPQYSLKLTIGKTNYLKDGTYISLSIQISEKRIHNEAIYPKKIDDYEYSSMIKLDKSEFNSIYRKSIDIQVLQWR